MRVDSESGLRCFPVPGVKKAIVQGISWGLDLSFRLRRAVGKDTVYSMRMNRAVREALAKAAGRERRTIASLLDKIIADYLEKEGYRVYERANRERRMSPRTKTALPSITHLEVGPLSVPFPCVVLNLSLGGALIAYPRGSDVKDTAIGGMPNFGLRFELPGVRDGFHFRCSARRVFNIGKGLKVGAAFVDPDDDALETLKSYLM